MLQKHLLLALLGALLIVNAPAAHAQSTQENKATQTSTVAKRIAKSAASFAAHTALTTCSSLTLWMATQFADDKALAPLVAAVGVPSIYGFYRGARGMVLDSKDIYHVLRNTKEEKPAQEQA